MRVVGVLDGSSLGLAVITLAAARELFELQGLATGAFVTSRAAPDDLEASLWAVPGVEYVSVKATVLDRVAAAFAGAEEILRIGVLLALVLAVLFLGLLASLDAKERAPDLAVLEALAWRRREVALSVLSEVLTRGLPAILIGILLAPPTAGFLMDQIAVVNHYRFPLSHSPGTYLAVGGAALALMSLSVLPALRATRRINASAVLRTIARE